jgi:hypothetical protein
MASFDDSAPTSEETPAQQFGNGEVCFRIPS